MAPRAAFVLVGVLAFSAPRSASASDECAASDATPGAPCTPPDDAGVTFCQRYACSDHGTCDAVVFNCGLDCTAAVNCDDATKSCTPASIYPGFCVIDGRCWSYDDPNPADACQVCNPPTSKIAWSIAPTCKDAGVDAGPSDAALDAADVAPPVDAAPKVDGELPAATACSCRAAGEGHGSPLFLVLSLVVLAWRRR